MPEKCAGGEQSAARQKIDFREYADHGAFDPPPKLFSQQASLSIAKWILGIFAGVLALDGIILLIALCRGDSVLFDKVVEVLKFLVQSVVPLVTLAVGYYLGDRGREDDT